MITGIQKDCKELRKKLKVKGSEVDRKKLFLISLPYLLVGYFCDKAAWLWRISPGDNASDKMLTTINGMAGMFSNPLPSFYPKDVLVGVGCGIVFYLLVYFKAKNAKKFRHGTEYGSAR